MFYIAKPVVGLRGGGPRSLAPSVGENGEFLISGTKMFITGEGGLFPPRSDPGPPLELLFQITVSQTVIPVMEMPENPDFPVSGIKEILKEPAQPGIP